MSYIAYLNILLMTEDGSDMPKVAGAFVHSQPAVDQSQSADISFATLAEAPGESFQDAKENLIKIVKVWPAFRWTLPYIQPKLD